MHGGTDAIGAGFQDCHVRLGLRVGPQGTRVLNRNDPKAAQNMNRQSAQPIDQPHVRTAD